eukprot:2988650-Heterocapsa_arctica.AAC.1
MVRVNKFGLGANALVRNLNASCTTTCPRSLKSIEAYPSTSSDCASPAAPALIDGAAGLAMTDYDDEENVNFVMALPASPAWRC